MSALDLNFSTGIPGLDGLLHGLKPGDNVVLQVAELEDYVPLVTPFYRRVLAEGKPLIYFRFARHAALVPEGSGAEICRLHPEAGFERFITEAIDVIEQAGRGACYVFDCLSELAVDWYSDRMLGNFFMLACPYLYKLDTIAYFALLKNHHSSVAIDAIQNTAQVYIPVYRHRESIYLQPLKVEGRHSPTMYMLNRWDDDGFHAVRNSAVTSEILTEMAHPWLDFTIHRPGVWTRTFTAARHVLEKIDKGEPPPDGVDTLRNRLLRMAITRDEPIVELASRYLSLADLIQILQRMIGTGLIGGKTLGMLLSRAILVADHAAWLDKLEPHDSFFIGSDVFYTYLVQNGCWWLRRRRRDMTLETVLENASAAREKIATGTFPDDIRHQFVEMLNYFGQAPLIVRSSSLLEDNYGNSFSGKYESVFCANQGTPAERLEAFTAAVRTVYASTMSEDALTYRAHRGLLAEDEQMALLVQRVSGTDYKKLFFPQMAGVAFSFNPYCWDEDIDPRAGVLRLVFGLGTRAVDRIEDDYARLVALSSPMKQPETATEDARKYSQRRIDVLDLEENRLKTHDLQDALKVVPTSVRELYTVRDRELERLARERGRSADFPYMLSFDRVLRNTTFVEDMRAMLQTLEAAYDNPVDVEFTANFLDDGECLVDLVQCRPLQVKVTVDGGAVKLPETIPDDDLFLETTGPVIGQGVATIVDRLIYVVPEVYAAMSMQQRYGVARLLGRVTHACPEDSGKVIMIIGPGRLGTRSPSLGIPVSFSEINTCSVLCEMAVMHEGLVPDLSLGTHFFNDLVEMEMICLAVFPDKEGNRVNVERLLGVQNRLLDILPDAGDWASAVHVIDGKDIAAGARLYFRADPLTQRAVCYSARN